uniref:SFRICE_033252 n=1 Tax=Spodoptera frugiperda TaxID=7108 RepID=A0A2H1WYM7_SPOFR
MARWLGNWPPYNVSRLRFPHGTILCVIHRLLFRVWVSCACELVVNEQSGHLMVSDQHRPWAHATPKDSQTRGRRIRSFLEALKLCRLTVAKLKGWRMAMIRKDTGGTRV